jgi:hypothetical protein
MKAYWGSGGIAPRILDLGTRLSSLLLTFQEGRDEQDFRTYKGDEGAHPASYPSSGHQRIFPWR